MVVADVAQDAGGVTGVEIIPLGVVVASLAADPLQVVGDLAPHALARGRLHDDAVNPPCCCGSQR